MSNELNGQDDPFNIAFDWWLPRPEGDNTDQELDDIGYKEYFSSKEELLEDIDWTLVAKVMKLALKTSANPELISKIRIQANHSDDK